MSLDVCVGGGVACTSTEHILGIPNAWRHVSGIHSEGKGDEYRKEIITSAALP